MRRAAIAVLTLGSIALLPARANAGGVDWFEFDRPNYSPGDSGVARTRVWFATKEAARKATEGRFAAYLVPEGRWIRPPGVPPAAIPLGPVTFSSPEGYTAMAALTFTVPEVSTGDWTVNVCNVPCTNEMIGDLLGGTIRVASSATMSTVLRLEDRLKVVREMAGYQERRTERQVHVLRVQLNALRTDVKLLDQRLDRRLHSSSDEPAGVTSFPAPVGWLLVGLTILFWLVAFRPRRRPVLAPYPPAIERIEETDREPVG
jgi:hypothetical protein